MSQGPASHLLPFPGILSVWRLPRLVGVGDLPIPALALPEASPGPRSGLGLPSVQGSEPYSQEEGEFRGQALMSGGRLGDLSSVCSDRGDVTLPAAGPSRGGLPSGPSRFHVDWLPGESRACAARNGLGAGFGRPVEVAGGATALNSRAFSLQGTLHPPPKSPPSAATLSSSCLPRPHNPSLAIAHGAFLSPIPLRLVRESGPREKTPKSLGMYSPCAPPPVSQARAPGLGPGIRIRAGGGDADVSCRAREFLGTSACSFMVTS